VKAVGYFKAMCGGSGQRNEMNAEKEQKRRKKERKKRRRKSER
jgi:hypothetical protein